MNWHDAVNGYGYVGGDFMTGKAGHGGSSPYEIGIKLFVQGPDFKTNLSSELPSSIIDIVPTILSLYGFAAPPGMDGRVLSELFLKDGDSTSVPDHDVLTTEVSFPNVTYKLRLEMSSVGKSRYFNFSRTERIGR